MGAAVELQGVPVLFPGLAPVYLGQVGGELRLAVPPRGHVGVGRDHLPPGLEALGDDGQGLLDRPLRLPLRLLLKAAPEELPGHAGRLLGLLGGDHLQEAGHAVQGPVGVLKGEGALVGPAVAELQKLLHQGPAPAPELLVKNLVPAVVHELEEGLGVGVLQGSPVPLKHLPRLRDPFLAVDPSVLPLHERPQPGPKEVQALAHDLPVAERHTSKLKPPNGPRGRQATPPRPSRRAGPGGEAPFAP